PRGIEAMGCEVSHEIGTIASADVVYILRMQRERMEEGASYVPSLREYSARWCVTPERLRAGQKVMHPGPMNRGVEIDPRVADSDASLVVDQVRAGLVVRMAVLYDLLTTGTVLVGTAVAVASSSSGPAGRRVWRAAAAARSSRCRTRTRSSTRPTCCAVCARAPKRKRRFRSASRRRSPSVRPDSG